MDKLGKWLIGFSLCFMSVGFAGQNCSSGTCSPSAAACAPGECYLFHELVNCSVNDFNCKDGVRRIWSYRPMFYAVDNSELLKNLDKKLCPNPKNCKWPYSTRPPY